MAGRRRESERASRENTPPLRLIPGGARTSAPGSPDPDIERNAHWNEMLSLAETAWCWRDPESIDALLATVANLRRVVRREWGG